MLHLYDHTTATMRGKLLSVATVVDAADPEMDRSETVTVFNDLVVLSAEGATRPIDPNSACGGRACSTSSASWPWFRRRSSSRREPHI